MRTPCRLSGFAKEGPKGPTQNIGGFPGREKDGFHGTEMKAISSEIEGQKNMVTSKRPATDAARLPVPDLNRSGSGGRRGFGNIVAVGGVRILALDTVGGPRNRVQPLVRDRLFTSMAFAVFAAINAR